MLTGGDYVQALFLGDATRFASVSRNEPPVTAAAPEWLHAALDQKSGESWVGRPLKMPGAVTLVPIARRAHLGGGHEAWAGALFDLRNLALAAVYRQTTPAGGFGLFTTDGTPLLLISSDPQQESRLQRGGPDLPTTVGDSALFQRMLRGAGPGVIEGINPYSGADSLVAYDRVPGYPLVAAAARGVDVALEPWRERERNTLLTAIGVTILVVGMTLLLNHFIRALRSRELHYRTLFNNAGFGAFVLEDQRVIEANRTSADMFGVPDTRDLMSLTPWDVSPPRQPDGGTSEERARERIRTALEQGTARFEWMHKRLSSGEAFWAEVELAALDAAGKALTLAVVHDVTERKRLDAERERVVNELQELAGTLVHLQDDERRRIGRELHDTTGQLLAALELKLDRLARAKDGSDAEQRAKLRECVELAHQCSAEIRTASYLLHPPLLDEIGLLSALRWLADGLRQRSEIETTLDLPQSMDRLPREHELALFRIAQEALTNVHRHSMSPTVSIRLAQHEGTVTLEIADAGRGILAGSGTGPVDEAGALGVGLAGMRERMRQLGGTLSVFSSPTGTTVRAELRSTAQTARHTDRLAG
jgi:PAS domain S-box-containing protein